MNLSLQTAALERLQNLINQSLLLDPGTRMSILELEGKSVGIETTFPSVSIMVYFLPDARVELTALEGKQTDVRLSGNPIALASFLARVEKVVSFAETGVTVSGDEDVLRKLGSVLQELDIDWEAAFAGLVGDTPAHLAGKAMRETGKWWKEVMSRSRTGFTEFLREESGLTVSRSEAEGWFAGVRHLMADTERLSARINRLKVAADKSRPEGESP